MYALTSDEIRGPAASRRVTHPQPRYAGERFASSPRSRRQRSWPSEQFNLTLSIFNETQLARHLLFYGIFALLLGWEADRRISAGGSTA